MRTKLNDWKNGWFGVELSIRPEEIDRLIKLLQRIKDDPDQHFHISSDFTGESGIGDIEVSIQQTDEPSNMIQFGTAIAPAIPK